MKPKALDLFCGAGGATRGLQRAGFYVVGVDIEAQPRYIGDEFYQADALTFPLDGYDFVWASPPCQAYSTATGQFRLRGYTYVDLIAPIRKRLIEWGGPFIIENVVTAPLQTVVMLCGSMFDLGTYRHRNFESNFLLFSPGHQCHSIPTVQLGRRPEPGKMMSIAGHISGVREAHKAMGINWRMSQDELSEAIPPAYSEFLGRQAIEYWARTKSFEERR